MSTALPVETRARRERTAFAPVSILVLILLPLLLMPLGAVFVFALHVGGLNARREREFVAAMRQSGVRP